MAGKQTPSLGGNGAGIVNFGNGGILNGAGGNATLKNSILANNTGGNCALHSPNTSAQRSFGHNISDDSSCVSFLTFSGDLNDISAGLDPNGLKNDGGPTLTIALLPTSPAVEPFHRIPIPP